MRTYVNYHVITRRFAGKFMSLYCEELHMNDHSSTLSHGRLRARRGAWAIACVALFLVQLVASAAGAPDTPAPVVVPL